MSERYKERLQTLSLRMLRLSKRTGCYLDRLHKKIDQILENPEHYPPKRHKLKGKRSAHAGPYVVLFEVAGEIVIFHKFRHHDHVYK